MTVETAARHLAKFDALDRVVEFDGSTATVELAAAALGVLPDMIAKTLAIRVKSSDEVVAVVTKGTARIDNAKFKTCFGGKAQFISAADCLETTGHPPGGVSPFGLRQGIPVYLDSSLKEFAEVYPAAGSPNNCMRLTVDELAAWTGGEWIDVCS